MKNTLWKKLLAVILSLAMTFGGLTGGLVTALAAETEMGYEQLFEGDGIINAYVTISDEDWQSILESPLDKDYKSVTVEINGITLENVGFSTKGNSTLTSVASMADSDRYSFRFKFDKFDKDQTYLGLDMLCMHNNYTDASFLREYLHYEALREIGAPTPLTVFINLYINGELVGFYTGVEGEKSSYLERNFGEEEDSVLYDTDSGADLVYKENDDYSKYEVDKGSDEDNAKLKNLISVLNDMPYGEKGNIESVLDVESALKYIAANGILGNYDSYNGDKKQNYKLYAGSDGVFYVIPWDYNMSFGGYGGSGEGMYSVSIEEPVYGTTMEKSPLIDKLLAVPEYYEKYLEYVNRLVDYMEGIEDRIVELGDLIRPYVNADPTKFYTTEQFEEQLTFNDSFSSATGGGNMGDRSEGFEPGEMPDGFNPGDRQQGQPGEMPDGFEQGDRPQGVEMPDGFEQGDRPEGMGGGGGMGASGSLMTFALNRLANLQEQLGRDVIALPNTAGTSDTPSSWATSQVNAAIAAGIVPEALQSKYTTAITRAEFCALAVALYEKVTGKEITERVQFSDTTDVNVEKMAALGVVSGVGDDKFSPDSSMTREQAATMLSRLATAIGKPLTEQAPAFADNANISSWAASAVGEVQEAGIMSGVGNNTFSPAADYTREQSIITIMRLFDIVK